MSSKLALKSLERSLQESRDPGASKNSRKELKKSIQKKKRRSKQTQAARQTKEQQQQQDRLEYFRATQQTQKATADLMCKLLGQPVQESEPESNFDLDF